MGKIIVKPYFKRLGWAGVALCGLCCALPFVGIALGVGALTTIAFYLEQIGMAALGLAGIFFTYYWYQKRQTSRKCDTSCETDCGCKTETGNLENRKIMKRAEEKPLASCNLSDAAQRKRGEQIKAQIFGKATAVIELEDGYDFIFQEPIAFANELLEMVNFERVCCPYFTWGFVFEPQNKATHLQVYGSAAIKEELRIGLTEMGIIR